MNATATVVLQNPGVLWWKAVRWMLRHAPEPAPSRTCFSSRSKARFSKESLSFRMPPESGGSRRRKHSAPGLSGAA